MLCVRGDRSSTRLQLVKGEAQHIPLTSCSTAPTLIFPFSLHLSLSVPVLLFLHITQLFSISLSPLSLSAATAPHITTGVQLKRSLPPETPNVLFIHPTCSEMQRLLHHHNDHSFRKIFNQSLSPGGQWPTPRAVCNIFNTQTNRVILFERFLLEPVRNGHVLM